MVVARGYLGQLAGTKIARLFGFSRADLYRETNSVAERNQVLRDEIHAIALDFPPYGYRNITHELRRRGWVVNMKRVLRLMRADGLCARRRKCGPALSAPRHGDVSESRYRLSRRAPDQLWVADFTYVRLFGSFIFVAIILDAFSRRCVGWSAAHHYRTDLTLAALRMALHRRQPPPDLIHHSDRGSQYAADEYVRVLRAYGVEISMSRAGTPSDNAICERFMRTFKEEEVLIRDYADIADAIRSMRRYLEVTYNQRRLHSALGYRPPAEFEGLYLEAQCLPTPA